MNLHEDKLIKLLLQAGQRYDLWRVYSDFLVSRKTLEKISTILEARGLSQSDWLESMVNKDFSNLRDEG